MINSEFLGQRLLKQGFETWMRYMFRIIEARPLVVEPIHADLFQTMEKLYAGKELRQNINVPPRSAKTTLAKYFIAYCWTISPKMNFIYTSYSESLLANISKELMTILEHPAYKAMYPQSRAIEGEEDITPKDDFWYEYLKQFYTGKNVYSAKKITTYQGGICLFSPIGGQITGYGCGVRSAKKFSGALIIDDGNKPADVRSQTMRDRVLRYYEETLLSRLNNPYVPIINIQQRLHVEDLSGTLEKKYRFNTLKKPLLDENGVCQIPSQYTPERIEELKKNNYMFLSQYQQEPIILGGQVIKRAYFRYYPVAKEYQYKRILIAADTAMKTKEYNDYSVFMAGGVTTDNKLHVLDMLRGKWEAPELEKMAVAIWNQFKLNPVTGLTCNGFYIEDKASGIGLIQGLTAKYGIPVIGVPASTDKLTRAENVLPYIESGQVYLPENENYNFNVDILSECEAFSRDMSHKHDDIVDTLGILIQEALGKTKISILDYFM
jgi:predicted phage terminase large subunit-like protein|nr:MAG TPA: Large Terminase [Caudoviricetes sp.]